MMLYTQPMKIELVGRTLVADRKTINPDVRTFFELNDVLKEPTDKNEDAYYMYREITKKNDLRYDITLIPQWRDQAEYAKTYGHCHPIAERDLTYPEIYQVLSGKAIFILQKELSAGDFFVSIVEAEKGDVLLIPPNFCHNTINAGEEDLILANLVSDNFTSDYSLYKRNRGAAYYYMSDKSIVQNPNYFISKNERIRPQKMNARYSFSCRDILTEFYTEPSKFDFLLHPSLLPSYKF